MSDNFNNRGIESAINRSKLYKKKGFRVFKRVADLLRILIPIIITAVVGYFGYHDAEGGLILGGVLLCFFMLGWGSLSIFRKKGDSKKKLILKALILPAGFSIFCGLIALYAFLTM